MRRHSGMVTLVETIVALGLISTVLLITNIRISPAPAMSEAQFWHQFRAMWERRVLIAAMGQSQEVEFTPTRVIFRANDHRTPATETLYWPANLKPKIKQQPPTIVKLGRNGHSRPFRLNIKKQSVNEWHHLTVLMGWGAYRYV
ncbi:type II secretion system protein [Lactiplantibacillus modestisalitolerans]|uniref:Type II secretion system protein n=1 Tax=Lactiplantibacillus modestisalitolerans TaxID=1457219 RepID=A0ABV5WV98_9LACO|nr:type II secretion system protein [Lactiplantibacillus modestisalitolerans]